MPASQSLVLSHHVISQTHEPRALALHCLLSQAVRSLMAKEKQMPASQSLVFLFGHYIIAYKKVADKLCIDVYQLSFSIILPKYCSMQYDR